MAAFTPLERSITVNAGVMSGGSRTNAVAAEALDRRFRGLRPVDRRCKIEISGGLIRPAMERTAGILKLFRKARELAAELGIELEESVSGGGSDGNFTVRLGRRLWTVWAPWGKGRTRRTRASWWTAWRTGQRWWRSYRGSI